MRLFNVFFTSVRDYVVKNRVYNLFVEVPLTKTAIYFQRQRYISRPNFFWKSHINLRIRYQVDEWY